MAKKKTPRTTNLLQIRLDPDLIKQLEEAALSTRIDEIEIVRAMIRTFVEQVNAGEKLDFPLRLDSLQEPTPVQLNSGEHSNESPPKTVAQGGRQLPQEPSAVMAVPAGSRSMGSVSSHSLNEDAPQPIVPLAPAKGENPNPKITRNRAALRKLGEREKLKGKIKS